MPEIESVEASGLDETHSLAVVSTDAIEAPKAVEPTPAPAVAEVKQAGKWAELLGTPDGIFNGANLVERWLATPRTVKTRKGHLELGRELTRETYDAGIARARAVTCH